VTDSIDYAEVGLIVGLEVHQQLLTERKLFCHCPAGLYTTSHDGAVLRHMRPTLSELGEYDGTALMEFKTRKNIIYLIHQSNTCTYELDDTPPFLVNTTAIDVAIEQCLMLGCDIVDEVHIARKQYLDGSIPTGFQRTAIVGLNGRLPFRGREIRVTQVSVEEDSCREVSDRGHLIVWRADRLGMPLIETVTGPDLRTPEEVEEAILLVGRVCRSTGHVRTGLGSSRQDVNVSVRGGRRVEIKGVPKAGWAPALVHSEAVRQVNLLKLRDELASRGITTENDLQIDHLDVTGQCRHSDIPVLQEEAWNELNSREVRRPGMELGKGPFCVRAIRLVGLRHTLDWPGQPGLTFTHELAGRVRVISGLDQQPVLLHHGNWPFGVESELARLRKAAGCQHEDGLLVVWGPERDTLTAAEEIRLRYIEALDGVPEETRQPFEDGHTDFERILPGPDRMYPDTDSPPHRVTTERVDGLRADLPEPPWQREERYLAAGVPRPVIHWLIRRGGANLVDRVVAERGVDIARACYFFGERLKGLRRAHVAVDAVSVERWLDLFSVLNERLAAWDGVNLLIRSVATQPDRPVAELADELGLGASPEGWRERVQQRALGATLDRPDGTTAQRRRFLIGQAMAGLRGRVPVAAVAAALGLEAAGGDL
jgi:glutamyl-tRNA(Gln) amidotransferase subunit E